MRYLDQYFLPIMNQVLLPALLFDIPLPSPAFPSGVASSRRDP